MNEREVVDVPEFTREYWDERYRSAATIWSGNVNPVLAAVAGPLEPGTALDVGSGEGADAIWLARRGWRVTGIDVSIVALDRAAKRAAESGVDIADRLHWQPADVFTWDPAPHRYDLVSAQFMHLPPADRAALHRRLAAAVRPGGTLLIVGHHPSDLDGSTDRAHLAELMFTADEIAATLDPLDWEVVLAAAVPRSAVDRDGQPKTVADAVLHAVRHR